MKLNGVKKKRGKKKEERDNLKHKSSKFRMLLKVLIDFCSLKIRDKAHAPTHIHKQKRKLTIIIIILIIIKTK